MGWGSAAAGGETRQARLESGQATVEWVGLVLAVALALGALAGGVRGAARGESTAGLGEAVAQRITCAARDACAAERSEGARGPGGVALGGPGAAPGARGSPATGRGGAPPSAPWRLPPRAVPGLGVPGLGAFPRPDRLGAVAKRAWIVCFAYRRWRSEVEHPRSPREPVPVGETLDILNDCLNPWDFFFG